MTRLIINADDYGLTAGINRGIEDCFAAGGLRSATLMAGASAAADAAQFAVAHPQMGVGCHVVLLDGSPLAPADQVQSLLQPGATHFYPTLGKFLRALYSGRINAAHIATETAHQLQRLRSLGIQPTHVDTHKHTHMFPAVLRAVLCAARDAGVTAIRNPFEPAWSVAATHGASRLRKVEVGALRTLYRSQFLSETARLGFATTDGAIGVAATGSLDAATLASLLRNMPDGTWELVCHPGYSDAALASVATRLRASRDVEVECLRQLPAMLPPHVQLVHFGDLR